MLERGSTIGIIGGGQLGRMLSMAAARLGFKTIILEPQPNSPASQVANEQIVAAYDDATALRDLASRSDVITYEFENIPASSLNAIVPLTPVFPPPDALEVSQDRLAEKQFLNAIGLATAPFFDCPDAASLDAALAQTGGRGILKTRRFGYDGKGQVRFRGNENDPSAKDALAECGHAPSILEGFIDFDCEISVIATRGKDGAVECYEPARNVHTNGILDTSTVPSGVDATIVRSAVELAMTLAEKLNYVGTLGLEFFVTKDGGLIANEFAPRVHNSGHWTEAACAVSQFEQHIRAVAGWPLAHQHRHSSCVMHNLIGDDILKIAELAHDPSIVVHDYGKAESRSGRKMGHYTQLIARQQQ